MTKEEFNKIWKDSTKEQILNQYYYDYEEMIKCHNIIKEAREYITSRAKKAGVELMPRELELLEILQGSDKE